MARNQMTTDVQELRRVIQAAIKKFETQPLAEAASDLFAVLGYASNKKLPLKPNTPENFLAKFAHGRSFNEKNLSPEEWKSVDFLFQLTDDEITAAGNRL